MPSVRLLWLAGALAAAAATLAVSLGLHTPSAAGAAAGTPKELLPDLDSAELSKISVAAASDGTGRVLLAFKSTTYNVGKGPLTIAGHRASTDEPQMGADQTISLSDGTTETVQGIGVVRYDPDKKYRRWGMTPFLSYELHRATDFALVTTHDDADFCITDIKAQKGKALPGQPGQRVFADKCRLRVPDALDVLMGVSVGWGTQHSDARKGQVVDISNVPTGRYWLVQRVNATKSIKESRYGNNASSVLLSIFKLTGGPLPTVKVLRACPDSATCKPPKKTKKKHHH